ncbi:uncharacterized protein ACR2FA_011543 [Aphomia sociella]
MSSVEDSFGKLVNDVVTDVSETIGCTILAVKQVLSLNGDFNESSDYNKRCRGATDQSTVREVDGSYSPQFAVSHKKASQLSDGLSQEIKESMMKANETGFNLINKHDAHHEIETVESMLKNEKNQLSEISSLFRRGFEHLPKNLRLKFGYMEKSVMEKPTIENIWHDIKILREIEHDNKDSPEAKEVHQVLDEALDILNINGTQTDISDDDKIKTIVKGLERESRSTLENIENQFDLWEKEEIKDSEDIKNIIPNNSEENNNTLSFKDFALNMLKDKRESTTKNGEEQSTVTPTASNEMIKLDDFLQFIPKDIQSRKAAAKEATKFVEENKHTDIVLHDYFTKSEDVGVSLFDNLDLFNFK